MNETFFIKKLHKKEKPIRLIWLHGWGVDHQTLLPLASFFNTETENYLLDLSGFGKSPAPKKVYDSTDYAKEIAGWLKTFKSKKPTYIIGHSFGGQTAIQIANLYPKLVDGLILIGASGLKRKRSLFFKTKFFIFKTITKMTKILFGQKFYNKLKTKLVSKIGSTDYKNANDIMRKILVKITQENLKDVASKIKTPTILIYGKEDLQAPSYFGKEYSKFIKNSEFVEIPKLNHYTILSTGKNQVQNLINNFIKK